MLPRLSKVPRGVVQQCRTCALTTTYHVSEASRDQWLENAKKELKGGDPDTQLLWKTPEGINIKPLYTKVWEKSIYLGKT